MALRDMRRLLAPGICAVASSMAMVGDCADTFFIVMVLALLSSKSACTPRRRLVHLGSALWAPYDIDKLAAITICPVSPVAAPAVLPACHSWCCVDLVII